MNIGLGISLQISMDAEAIADAYKLAGDIIAELNKIKGVIVEGSSVGAGVKHDIKAIRSQENPSVGFKMGG